LTTLPAAQASGLTLERCVQALRSSPAITRLPLLIDLLDADTQRHRRLSWRQAITHQVSQTCAAYFDAHQADWQPDRRQGLYAFWRDTPFPRVSFSLLEGGDRAALLRFADIEPETDRTLCVLGAERGRVRAEDQRMWLWLHPETFGRVCPQFPPPFGVLAGEGGTFVVKTDIIGALRALNRRRHEQEQDG
jgi:hypothetical protein